MRIAYQFWLVWKKRSARAARIGHGKRDNREPSKVLGWGRTDTATGDTMAGFGALQRFKLQVAVDRRQRKREGSSGPASEVRKVEAANALCLLAKVPNRSIFHALSKQRTPRWP